MLGKKFSTSLGVFALTLALSLAAASVQAASACKGLDKGACSSKGDCSWVNKYKRKDGVEVAGHCKSKPKSSGKSSSKKKSDSKKTTDKKKSDK
jgi:hypothetical protein